MVFERVKAVVDNKLAKVGLDIPYRIWLENKGESWASEEKHIVHLNPNDCNSGMLAGRCLQHIVLHEIGHIFAYEKLTNKIRCSNEVCGLFGDTTSHYRRNMCRKLNCSDYISTYAQVHPTDNFCEVFAVYVAKEGNINEIKIFLKQRNKSDKVLKQMYWMNKFVKSNK